MIKVHNVVWKFNKKRLGQDSGPCVFPAMYLTNATWALVMCVQRPGGPETRWYSRVLKANPQELKIS